MAWRIITHRCGHRERVNVDGAYVVVEQRVRRAEESLCASCAGNISRRDNMLAGFCTLLGPKDQCDRAEPIRMRVLNQVEVLASHARIEDRDAFRELRRQVLCRDDAAWWIEHRNDAVTILAQDIEL